MRSFTCIALLFLLNTVSAQQLPLETYTPANGLVDARVINIFQDSKGRIYFLTREGFSIFDGQRFSNYGNEGINRTEIINGITEYSDGTVRLYSFDGNIYEVIGTTVTIDSTHRKLLSEVTLSVNISPDEKIIATNYLLVKEKNKTFQRINIPYQFAEMPRIDNIFWANPYLLIIRNIPGTGHLLYLYNYQLHVPADSLYVDDISFSTSDKKGNVFFFSKTWLQLNKAALGNGKLKTEPIYFSNNIPAGFLNATISFDNNNDPWLISSEKGYCKPGPENSSTEYFTTDQGLLGGARFIFQDAENNYWFISSANGVQKMQQSPLQKINNFKNLPAGYVTSINKDEKGNICANTTTGLFLNEEKIGNYEPGLKYGPFYFHDQYWQFTNYKTLRSSKGVQFNLVDHIPDYIQNDLSPSFTSIDREGRLIIAGTILFIIDKELKLHTYRLPYFCDNVIIDKDNNYLCFTRSNDMLKLAWKNGKLQEVFKKNIPGLNPRYSILWNDTTIISGTRFEGLKIFNYKNTQLTYTRSITKNSGISNNFIYSLLKKNDSQLLVGTGTGLVSITMTEKDTIIENLSLRNNIFPPFVNLLNAKDSSTICLTGSGSLYKLQKETKLSSRYIPTAFLRAVAVNGKEIDTVTKRFAFDENNFLFSISAPTFLDNKNMKFNFLLAGEDKTWRQYSNTADYLINNLPPGNYTLTATVQYPGRYYPDKQLVYSFSIKNPYWKQWWFITLSGLMAIAVIYLVFSSYYKKQLAKQQVIVERQQAVEKERTRIAADMHDDLGSGLTKITYLSQMAINKEDSKADLQAIKKTSTELVENMSEIIWAMKEENNSLEDLLYYIKLYAVEYCSANNLNCIIEFPEKIQAGIVTGQDRRNIYLATKEALHNIVKHAAAKNVSIKATLDTELMLCISDDGKGIDLNSNKFEYSFGGNGLKNISNRIEAVMGKMEIRNDHGTAVIFHIPV